MGERVERLLTTLERESYKGRVLGLPVSMALIQSRESVGTSLPHATGCVGLGSGYLEPLDAYTCAVCCRVHPSGVPEKQSVSLQPH